MPSDRTPIFRLVVGYGSGCGSQQQLLGEYAGNHPLLKIWLIYSCALVVPATINNITTSENAMFEGQPGYVAMAAFIVPLIAYPEFVRYREAGRSG